MPAFFANAIGSTSGILYHYTLPDNPVNDWLVEQTMARFSVPPDLFDADGMNAAILVVEALRATGGDAVAAALIGVMEGMEFEGPKGTIYIRPEDHVAIQDMYIATLTNVDDPEALVLRVRLHHGSMRCPASCRKGCKTVVVICPLVA